MFAERLSTTNGQLHLIVRGAYDRALADGPPTFWQFAEHQLYEQSRDSKRESHKLPKSPGTRDARTAVVNACNFVTIIPGSGFEPVTLTAVLVRAESRQLMCLFNAIDNPSIDTIEDVQRIVQYYCQRWGIEVYFRH